MIDFGPNAMSRHNKEFDALCVFFEIVVYGPKLDTGVKICKALFLLPNMYLWT